MSLVWYIVTCTCTVLFLIHGIEAVMDAQHAAGTILLLCGAVLLWACVKFDLAHE